VSTQPQSKPASEPDRLRTAGGLYGHVVETLGNEITGGHMPAQQIIYAAQLTERFGISRSVVRESIRTLSSMGLLEARPQVGTRVLPIERWDLLNPRIIAWRASGPDALVQQRELIELRLGIEPLAARLAAERIDDEVAQELVRCADAMHAAIQERDSFRFFEVDSLFHRLLLTASKNQLITKFFAAIDAGLRVRENLPPSQLNVRATELHVDLARALVARDPAMASQLATRILEQTLLELEEGDGF